MSTTTELLRNLNPETAGRLFAQMRMFSGKPQLAMKWHACISSPLLGQQTYAFDDFDGLCRELSKVADKLVMGKLHIYYGYKLPVTTDGSGQNLFTVDLEGNEVSITGGYSERVPLDQDSFGIKGETINIDELI